MKVETKIKLNRIRKMAKKKKEFSDMSTIEKAISMSNVLAESRAYTDPEILKEVEAERAQEEKEDAELLKKGIMRSRVCDPFDVMRIAKKIREKKKKDESRDKDKA